MGKWKNNPVCCALKLDSMLLYSVFTCIRKWSSKTSFKGCKLNWVCAHGFSKGIIETNSLRHTPHRVKVGISGFPRAASSSQVGRADRPCRASAFTGLLFHSIPSSLSSLLFLCQHCSGKNPRHHAGVRTRSEGRLRTFYLSSDGPDSAVVVGLKATYQHAAFLLRDFGRTVTHAM